MIRPPLILAAALFLALAGWNGHAAAHGGAHEKPADAQPATAPSPYALEPSPDEKPLEGDDLLSPFSRDTLGMEDHTLEGGHAMDEGMDHATGGHAMPEVEPARHTLVPTSKNGYPWAVAATAVFALLFGALTLRRG